jgi:hypothetical protein
MGKISKALRFEILTRDGFRCRYCGATSATSQLHIDHVLPRSAGGDDSAANLVAACADCNHGKSDRIVLGAPQGFMLSPDKRPARIARMRHTKAHPKGEELHELDCCEIDEEDEIDDGSQLCSVWCMTHQKYEWHSIPLDYVRHGGAVTKFRKPVEW